MALSPYLTAVSLPPPRYDSVQQLVDAGPGTLLRLADRETRPLIAGYLRDLSGCYSAGRRIALARLVIDSARARHPEKTARR